MPYKDKEKQKVKQKQYASKHYKVNKQVMIARAVAHKKATRIVVAKFIGDYLLWHPCVDCGEKDPIVLEFDHTGNDKIANISDMARTLGYSISRIKTEIAKCEVRCANCHRRITHRRRDLNKMNLLS